MDVWDNRTYIVLKAPLNSNQPTDSRTTLLLPTLLGAGLEKI